MEITIAQLIKSMPEDKMAHFGARGDNFTIQAEDRDSKLIELTNDPNLFHILMMANRPGVGEFQTHLEHEYFPPEDYELNDKMDVRIVKWNGLLWDFISIPYSMKDAAYKTAESVKMRFEVEGAIPHMIGGGEISSFPVSESVGNRIVHLINNSDSGVYNGPLGSKDAEIEERARVREYMRQKGLTDEQIYKEAKLDVPLPDDYDPWN
jgi:hypothetical protein